MDTKQRKPVEDLRVPLNCLIRPETKELLAGIHNLTGESQGQVIDRLVKEGYQSASTSLNALMKKRNKQERAISERAASDVVAQQAERNDIDYSDIDSTPTTHVSTLDVVGPTLTGGTGKASIESWRKSRKPLLKPSQR